MVAGLESTTEGQIMIGARDVTRAEPADRGVAMVFQTYALYPHMSVRENMGFGLKMTGSPREEITRKVGEAAEILKLGPYLDRRPAALSGGQRQRVAIGRAIVRGPEVFLFDEPLSNLDAELRVDMRVEIARLHGEIGATMIYVTHDQVEAMTLADKIVVLRAGHIEQVGAPMDLYKDPDNKFVAGFIGSPSMNFLKGVVTEGGVRVPGLEDRVIPTEVALPGAGAEVLVGLRPQEMAIGDNGAGIKLDLRERLGGVAYDYLTAPTGERLIVESRDDQAKPQGTPVTVDFDPAKAYFFDMQTEQRLR
jgi:lactose/L-arabinose transport system ATP-binding protein